MPLNDTRSRAKQALMLDHHSSMLSRACSNCTSCTAPTQRVCSMPQHHTPAHSSQLSLLCPCSKPSRQAERSPHTHLTMARLLDLQPQAQSQPPQQRRGAGQALAPTSEPESKPNPFSSWVCFALVVCHPVAMKRVPGAGHSDACRRVCFAMPPPGLCPDGSGTEPEPNPFGFWVRHWHQG